MGFGMGIACAFARIAFMARTMFGCSGKRADSNLRIGRAGEGCFVRLLADARVGSEA